MVSSVYFTTGSQLIALQGFKAIFTSPSSANEVDGDGNGADVIENNRRARTRSDQARVKTCVASIIGMRKVTPRAIAYAACQVSHHNTKLPLTMEPKFNCADPFCTF